MIAPVLDQDVAPAARDLPGGLRLALRLGRQLVRDRGAILAATVVGVFIVLAIVAPLISPHNPVANSIPNAMRPPFWVSGGSFDWPLGTDWLGRDILSRTIYGARVSLVVGFAAVGLSLVIGVTIGLLSGYVGGRLDAILMRIADVQLAIPTVLLAVALAATSGRSLASVVVVLAVTRWVAYARITRGLTLSLREQEYVLAAKCVGASHPRLILGHILPNAMTPIIVLATIELALVINAESALSFLGVGVQPPTATWGGMIALGRDYLTTSWWMSVVPGVALMATILAINVLGDWLRDALDPRRVHRSP
jgi:peptide/nickel transport system permease protein